MNHFSGSYSPNDVTFLLKPLQVRSGVKGRGSEFLKMEQPPSPDYVRLYQLALARNGARFAGHLRRLAAQVNANVQGPITVVSLARAGAPIGVLLNRVLASAYSRDVCHYSISIIRGRGLDVNAMRHILEHRPDTSIVFVDGWTGNGGIGREIDQTVTEFNQSHGTRVSPALYVAADIAGTASVTASRDDYLLPSAVLNSTVSGLVSRTVLNDEIGPSDFHGCAFYEHLRPHDISQEFIDQMYPVVMAAQEVLPDRAPVNGGDLAQYVTDYLKSRGLPGTNWVKPGVAEAARVLLRKTAHHLVLRDYDHPDTAHLLHLANTSGVSVTQDHALPCLALASVLISD